MNKGMVAGYFAKDTEERLKNRMYMEQYYRSIGCSVMISEADANKPVPMAEINNAAIQYARSCGYKWLLINDMDSLVPKEQLLEAIEMIEMGYTIALPYDGRFINHYKKPNFKFTLNLADLTKGEPMSTGDSVGSSVMVNLDTIPFENENIRGLCFEDDYRIEVSRKLGLLVGRVPGILYHMDHPRSTNAQRMETPETQNNLRLYRELQSMTKEQVAALVKAGYKAVK